MPQKRVVSGVLWSFLQNVAARLISFGVFAVLGRLLSPTSFGLVAIGQAAVDLTVLLVGQGTTAFLVHREDTEQGAASTAFWSNVAISVALCAALVAGAPHIAALSDAPEATPILRALALSLPFHGVAQVHVALLTRSFQFRQLAMRTGLAALVGGACGLGAALAGWGPYALVTQILVGQVVSTGALWWASQWKPRFVWSRPMALEQLRFSGSITAATVLRAISTRLDAFLVAALLGPAALGAYSVARRVLQICSNLLSKSGDAVAMSTFARQQHDPELLRSSFLSALAFSAFVSTPAFTGLAVVADDAVRLLFGSQWNQAVPVLRWLCLAGVMMAFGYVNSALLQAVGRPVVLTWAQLAITVAYLPSLVVLSRYGIPGVAAAYAGALTLTLPLSYWLISRLTAVNVTGWWIAPAKAVAASLVMGLGVLGSKHALAAAPAWARLIACTGIGALVYLFAARLLLPEQTQQLRAVATALAKRRRGRPTR